jgi:hypothetical protein
MFLLQLEDLESWGLEDYLSICIYFYFILALANGDRPKVVAAK